MTVAIFPSRLSVFPSELLKLPWQSPLLANTRKYWLVELAQYEKILASRAGPIRTRIGPAHKVRWPGMG